MKFMFLFTSLLFLSTSAFATSLRTTQQEIFENVQVNGHDSSYTGVLTVDFYKKVMKLDIYSDPCGQFRAVSGEIRCMAMAVPVDSFEVPLMSTEQVCGSFVYSGVKDESIYDGFKTEISFSNHSGRVCTDLAHNFEVDVKVWNPWTGKTVHFYLWK